MKQYKNFSTNIQDYKCILTKREIEYLSLAAFGFHNNKIGEILFVSYCTVKKTFENIFRKLSAIDRANAITIAFIHKIITPEILAGIADKYDIKSPVMFLNLYNSDIKE